MRAVIRWQVAGNQVVTSDGVELDTSVSSAQAETTACSATNMPAEGSTTARQTIPLNHIV